MASELAQLTADVVAAVEGFGGTLAGIRVERRYLGLKKLEEITAQPSITVVPAAQTKTRRSRGEHDRERRISLAYQEKLVADETADAVDPGDAAMEKAEALAEGFEVGDGIGSGDGLHQITEILHEPIFVQEHLRQHGVFTSVVTLVLRRVKG